MHFAPNFTDDIFARINDGQHASNESLLGSEVNVWLDKSSRCLVLRLSWCSAQPASSGGLFVHGEGRGARGLLSWYFGVSDLKGIDKAIPR